MSSYKLYIIRIISSTTTIQWGHGVFTEPFVQHDVAEQIIVSHKTRLHTVQIDSVTCSNIWLRVLSGGNPYSTDNIDEHFVDKLKRGYRLDKPTFATDIMYASSAVRCWFFLVLFLLITFVCVSSCKLQLSHQNHKPRQIGCWMITSAIRHQFSPNFAYGSNMWSVECLVCETNQK